MKKTYFKDAIRNIRKQFVSFLSIVVIAAMAEVAYLGIVYSSEATLRSAENYYSEHRMWDLQITSTLLMDQEDLDAIRALDYVELAVPVQVFPVYLTSEGQKENATLMSLSGELATFDLVEGRLPETAQECILETRIAHTCGYKVGSRIRIENETLAGIDPILQKDYVVTGLFIHPDHISPQVPFTPYILVQDACFDREALDGQFAQVRIQVRGAPAERYGDAYQKLIDEVKADLAPFAERRAVGRTEDIRGRYEQELQEARDKLADAAQKLRDSRQKLDEGQAELEKGAEELGIGKEKLDAAPPLMHEAEAKIRDGEAQLKAGKAILDEIAGYIQNGAAWIHEKITPETWPENQWVSYEEFMDTVDHGETAILEFIYEKSGYNAGVAKLKRALSALERARLDWYYMGEEYLDGMTLYERGKKKLDEAEAAYAEGQAQYEDGMRQLKEAEEKLDQLDQCRWVVLDNYDNAGFIFAENNGKNIQALSLSFSLIFLAIAAIVIYATVGRIVGEQSKLVGATKAMGFYNREILAKYLIFGCGATIIGLLLGILVSYFGMQFFILQAQTAFFIFGKPDSVFLPLPTLIVLIGGMVLSVLSVWLACSGLLHTPPIQLMQGAAEASALKKARKSSKGSLYTRLIFLNMRADSKRVLVTIVSVAGCCLLLVVGFVLKFGISRVCDRQYGPKAVVRYEAQVFYDRAAGENVQEQFRRRLEELALPSLEARQESLVIEPNGHFTSATLLCADPAGLSEFYGLYDAKTKQPIAVPGSGVLVPKRFHEAYEINVGESFAVFDSALNSNDARVAGVFNNYFGHLLFFSPAAYQETFGHEMEANCFLVKTGKMRLDELSAKLSDLPGFLSVKSAAAERSQFNKLSGLINYVVVLMILIAGMMAYFILVNLSKTYILKKSRELTIMRINGFTVRECVRYAAWDLFLTTVVGILLGMAVGGPLGSWVIQRLEQPFIQFVRTPDLRSFVYGALITAGFSYLINAAALRHVKHLKLSDLS
ncbi:MAG: hypothetical protein J5967_03155 [Oscillospiraceae bacterium]|nr:hypothetical protein [Oscillospiraceae bacterium]